MTQLWAFRITGIVQPGWPECSNNSERVIGREYYKIIFPPTKSHIGLGAVMSAGAWSLWSLSQLCTSLLILTTGFHGAHTMFEDIEESGRLINNVVGLLIKGQGFRVTKLKQGSFGM